MEQEATAVDQWFGRHAVGWTTMADLKTQLDSPQARGDGYYRYIARNIRMGEDDQD
jgi:hypothetical protein